MILSSMSTYITYATYVNVDKYIVQDKPGNWTNFCHVFPYTSAMGRRVLMSISYLDHISYLAVEA